MDPTALIQQIAAAATDVRRALKGRQLADRFEPAVVAQLAVRGVRCTAEHREPIDYRGGGHAVGYHVDLRVAGCPVVAELKVLDGLHATDDPQMLNRLRLGVWQRGAVNLNLLVSNRGVQSDVFDLRHLGQPAAPAAGRLRPMATPRRAA